MEILKILSIETLNSAVFSGSSWHSPADKAEVDSINPATGNKLGSIASCTEKDYQHLIKLAEKASLLWKKYTAPARGEIIRLIGLELRKFKDSLGTLVSLETGKSKQEADGEVQEMIDLADFAVGQSRMLYGNTMHSERPQHRMYEQWHPYGLIAVISAFNFPVAVWSWNAFIAAICGNVTIWKPSIKTPLAAIAVHKICARVLKAAKCPDIFGLVIPSNHELADTLVTDRRISLVSFTGSTQVGKQVAAKVSGRLAKVILELGGNNALIIDETADLKLAIPAVVFGAIGTAGQRCTSTRRLFIHQSRFDEVLKRLKIAYKSISIGNPLESKNHMGPLIDAQAVEQYKNVIMQIKAQGGEIVFGGEVIKSSGFFVEPTIVTGIKANSILVQEENFVPILYVMSYKNIDEAISLQNAVPQGLSSALFTQNLKHAEQFLSAEGSDCGIANINIGTSGAEIGGAFGGEKDTGGGREAGSDSWKAYMRRQTNTINWGDSLPLAQGIKFDL